MPDQAKILNERIERPMPYGQWTFQTRWRGEHTWEYEVKASYAADTDPVVRPGSRNLPNSIAVGERSGNTIRFTRRGAELLVDALSAALAWNGE